jgi:hypothetical protein
LKKLIIIICILLFNSGAFAVGNIYIDGMGAFTQTSDLKNEYGGGGSLLYQISDDFNLFIRNIFNQRKIEDKTALGESYYSKYKYFMSLAGVEYLYNINKLPLFWKNSLGLGAGSATIQTDFNSWSRKYQNDISDTGLCIAVWTGAMYVFTQSISAYMDIGYHKTYFFDKLKDEKIMGLQVILGVRFTLWGVNKSIYSEY